MIKIALGVYGILEMTIGGRSPPAWSQSKSRIEKWFAFDRHKPSYRSVTTLDARRIPTCN
jgi:hypothetical protein